MNSNLKNDGPIAHLDNMNFRLFVEKTMHIKSAGINIHKTANPLV